MSFNNSGIQHILDETLQRFFMDSNYTTDISLNYLHEWVTTPMFPRTNPNVDEGFNNSTTQTVEEDDNDSIPDLIDPVTGPTPVMAPSTDRGLQLWSNVINDYHEQMKMYQNNVQTILDITQTFLPTDNRRQNLPNRRNANINLDYWRDLLRNNTYTIDVERILAPNNRNELPPTENQIINATSVFVYDLSNNILESTVCPISLEDFCDGESLSRINHCGHVFKTVELSRWFVRNAHCPSCRYDIRQN